MKKNLLFHVNRMVSASDHGYNPYSWNVSINPFPSHTHWTVEWMDPINSSQIVRVVVVEYKTHAREFVAL